MGSPKIGIAKIARGTLVGGGLGAASLGPVLMSGGVQVLPVHELFGDLAILSLWTLAAVGARSGIGRGKVALAGVWGVVALALGGAQKLALDPTLHAVSQVLHVVSCIGVMVGGMLLARAVLKRAAPASQAPTIAEAAAEFLARKRIAVTGVSRKGDDSHGANVVYRRLRERGYQVFAVNPNAEVVEGDPAYRDLRSIPGGVDAVVIGTRRERALGTVQECAELGIRHVWMHRGLGSGSVSEEAAAWGRAHGIRVIDGGCPLMFGPTADAGHQAMRGLLTLAGRVPRRVGSISLLVATLALAGGCPDPAEMKPGKSCGSCHGEHAAAFGAAGTVYTAPDADADDGLEGVTIELTDADGEHITLASNAAGNFFSRARLTPPLQVTISAAGAQASMHDAPHGDCNDCHAPGAGHPGRIHLRP